MDTSTVNFEYMQHTNLLKLEALAHRLFVRKLFKIFPQNLHKKDLCLSLILNKVVGCMAMTLLKKDSDASIFPEMATSETQITGVFFKCIPISCRWSFSIRPENKKSLVL